MSSEIAEPWAVSCRGLGKAYRVYDRPHHRMLELMGLRDPERARKRWALRGVDLTIRTGECVGIVGKNGAGKSTLLQIIAGTVRATEGTATVRGRVAALLELNAGFNPELTGRENVGLRAMVLGLTPRQARERMNDIIAFAGIGTQIDEPVRTYSSGMRARLAFAVAAHVDADVLIVDETLAVGDGMFVQKCMRWIRAFRARGTLLFVSHSTQLVTDLCDRAVWLEEGRVLLDGVSRDVVREYTASIHGQATGQSMRTGRGLQQTTDTPTDQPAAAAPADIRREEIERLGLAAVMDNLRFNPDADWWGRGGATIDSVRVLDRDARPVSRLPTDGEVLIEVVCTAHERLERPVVGYSIANHRGLILFADNSWLIYGPDGCPPINAGTRFITHFRLRLPALPAGEYAVGAAVADGVPKNFVQHHRSDAAVLFRVASSHLVEGIAGVPMLGCTIRTIEPAADREVPA
ncbi:MAG: ABC transporter ATP-binding protein [Planctomycetota bacterium]|nr:MAG: ABC transporter ATP-binding protein [Planctomycetota bacterium]